MVQRGRPPLGPEEVATKTRDYCARYRVTPGPDGMPPFPAGRRETSQHREWLTVYRAHQRLARRLAAAPSRVAAPAADPGAGALPAAATQRTTTTSGQLCAVCSRPERVHGGFVSYRGRGRDVLRVHDACAELLRRAAEAGPDAVARVAGLLWPRGSR